MIVLHVAIVAMDTSDCLACGHCCLGYQSLSCMWPLLPWIPVIVLSVAIPVIVVPVATVAMDTSDCLVCDYCCHGYL